MSGMEICYDNAVIENFFYSLKVERASWKKYQTKQEAEEDLNWWIGSWYNPVRLHSSLGHIALKVFEKEKNVAEVNVGSIKARLVVYGSMMYVGEW